MASTSPISVLGIRPGGLIKIPAAFRKEHRLAKGGKVVAVRAGDSLVLVPQDHEVEAIFHRMEMALKASGLRVKDVQRQVLIERGKIARERYPSLFAGRGRGRKRKK